MNTLVLIKPDIIERNLVGQLIARIESNKFQIIRLRSVFDYNRMKAHYFVYQDRDYFNDLIEYMTSSYVIAIELTHPGDAVSAMKQLVGDIDIVGTLRYEFGEDFRRNSIHTSSSNTDAIYELSLWFP